MRLQGAECSRRSDRGGEKVVASMDSPDTKRFGITRATPWQSKWKDTDSWPVLRSTMASTPWSSVGFRIGSKERRKQTQRILSPVQPVMRRRSHLKFWPICDVAIWWIAAKRRSLLWAVPHLCMRRGGAAGGMNSGDTGSRLFELITLLAEAGADWLGLEILDGVRSGLAVEESRQSLLNAQMAARFGRHPEIDKERVLAFPPPQELHGDEQLTWAAAYVIERLTDEAEMLKASLDDLTSSLLAECHPLDGPSATSESPACHVTSRRGRTNHRDGRRRHSS